MIGLEARSYVGGPITIDGSSGEGGGQVLRSALALALVSGRPFRLENIRRRRLRAGLLAHHATAIAAAATIGDATVVGGEEGSETLIFRPGKVAHGRYGFAVPGPGSAALVLHTILPALLLVPGQSELVLEGGTDVPDAPPFDHLAETYLPLIRAMGGEVTIELGRHGFRPRGGGRFVVKVTGGSLRPLELSDRGGLRAVELVARIAAGGSTGSAARRLGRLRERLGLPESATRIEVVASIGPGRTLAALVRSDYATEVFTAADLRTFGSRGELRALADSVERYLGSDAPVGEFTADQLLVLVALAGGGSFRTLAPTRHTTTQAALVPAFLDVDVSLVEEGSDATRVVIAPLLHPGS